MDTFVDSSWYFARFTDPTLTDRPTDRATVDPLAAGRPVYRRHRARDPAPALFALLHPRHEEDRAMPASTSPSRACSRRAWWCTRPTGTRTAPGCCRPTCASRPRAATRKAFHVKTGAPVEIGSIEKMSKSKKNTVDPDEIIASYGADTARWFMLSDSPPERDVIWTEEGVQGAGRFVQRVWRLVGELADRMRRRRTAPAADGPHRHAPSARPPTRRSPPSRRMSSACASTAASPISTSSPTPCRICSSQAKTTDEPGLARGLRARPGASSCSSSPR